MIVYNTPSDVEDETSFVDNEQLSSLAEIVLNDHTQIRSAVVISPADEKWKEWLRIHSASKFTFYRVRSVHQLLRNPIFLDNHLFVVLQETHQCSKGSLGLLLASRIPFYHEIICPEDFSEEKGIVHFANACRKLELNLKIEEVAENFLQTHISKPNSGNRLKTDKPNSFFHENIGHSPKNLLVSKLKELLSESPETFLENAIKEIKEK